MPSIFLGSLYLTSHPTRVLRLLVKAPLLSMTMVLDTTMTGPSAL